MNQIVIILFFGLLVAGCNNPNSQASESQTSKEQPSNTQARTTADIPEVHFESEEARTIFNKTYQLYNDFLQANEAGNSEQAATIADDLKKEIAETKVLMGKLTEQDNQILNKFIYSIEGRVNKMNGQ